MYFVKCWTVEPSHGCSSTVSSHHTEQAQSLVLMYVFSSGLDESRVHDACSMPLLQSGLKGNQTSIE